MTEHASAFSIDGRVFEFEAPVADLLPLGGYVEVQTPGHRYLGQIMTERGTRRDDGTAVAVGSGALVASLNDSDDALRLESAPFGDASIGAASTEAIRSYLTLRGGDSVALDIGTIRPEVDAPARLEASGFSRHTFMCGQSGSGKTYAMGVMLERLLAQTDLRIIVLDPNSDYVHLGSIVDEPAGQSDGPSGIRRLLGDQRERVHVFGGAGSPLRIQFGRLTLRQQAMVLGLDRLADAEEVDIARRIVTEIGSTEYSLRDLRARADVMDEAAARRLTLRIDNLGIENDDIWAQPGEAPVTDRLPDDWRAVVFDLGSIEMARARSIVAAGVVSLIWDRRRERQPVLLMIDEAHNVCPQEPTDSSQALATEHLIAIAGEGRKFGIYLFLATQRPQKVHESVLSQCDNLLLMKMNGAADIQRLAMLFSFVPPSLIEMSAGFGLGEGLAAGRITPGPVFFKTGTRYTPEGGADIPTDWARPRS